MGWEPPSGGGSNTAGTVVLTVPTPSTGVAFVPSANQDCDLTFFVKTAAAFTVTYGPSTGAENTILTSTTLPVGVMFSKRIPTGWSVIITGTIADLENLLVQTC
jgi:hypothetical protein